MSALMLTARVTSEMDEQTSRKKPALDAPVGVAVPQPIMPAPTGDGMVALSYFMSGILFYGGLGWAGFHYLDLAWSLPVGLVLGFVTSMYLVIKRYSVPVETVTTGKQTLEKEQ